MKNEYIVAFEIVDSNEAGTPLDAAAQLARFLSAEGFNLIYKVTNVTTNEVFYVDLEDNTVTPAEKDQG